jgi:hypothetical protein
MALERELATYRRRLPELLANEGKFVVIHGDDVIGIVDTLDAALYLGYDRFINEPFMARQIRKTEPVLFSSRSLRPCPSLPDC